MVTVKFWRCLRPGPLINRALRSRPSGECRYRKEMMHAIREAAVESCMMKASSLSFGLRVIRTFEQVNKVPFDPFDSYHRLLVRGMGAYEATFWRVRRIQPPTIP